MVGEEREAHGARSTWGVGHCRVAAAAGAALVLLAANSVVLGLIWLVQAEVTPHGLDHTLDGVGDALLYGSLVLCGVCALLLAASDVRRRQWGSVVGWPLLLALIAGSPVLAILLYYVGGGTDIEGSSSLPQMGIFADSVLSYVALPAVAAVAAFRQGSRPRWLLPGE